MDLGLLKGQLEHGSSWSLEQAPGDLTCCRGLHYPITCLLLGRVSRDIVHRSPYNVSSYLSSSLFQDLPAPSNKDSSSWLSLPGLLSFQAASPVLTMALVGWSLEKSGWGSTHLHPEPCCSLQTSGDLPLWESPFSGGLRNCVLSTLGQEQGGRQFVCEFCPLLWKAAGF